MSRIPDDRLAVILDTGGVDATPWEVAAMAN